MADKSDRGRGPVPIREIIPEVLTKMFARAAVHQATERQKHLERRCVPIRNPEDSVPN